MPRGKELEQLPMAHIAPGAGRGLGKWDRESLKEAPVIETQDNRDRSAGKR